MIRYFSKDRLMADFSSSSNKNISSGFFKNGSGSENKNQNQSSELYSQEGMSISNSNENINSIRKFAEVTASSTANFNNKSQENNSISIINGEVNYFTNKNNIIQRFINLYSIEINNSDLLLNHIKKNYESEEVQNKLLNCYNNELYIEAKEKLKNTEYYNELQIIDVRNLKDFLNKEGSKNLYNYLQCEEGINNFLDPAFLFDVDKEIADYFRKKYLDSDYKNSIPTFDEIKYFILNNYCKIQHP